jgi:hypothetical protein
MSRVGGVLMDDSTRIRDVRRIRLRWGKAFFHHITIAHFLVSRILHDSAQLVEQPAYVARVRVMVDIDEDALSLSVMDELNGF